MERLRRARRGSSSTKRVIPALLELRLKRHRSQLRFQLAPDLGPVVATDGEAHGISNEAVGADHVAPQERCPPPPLRWRRWPPHTRGAGARRSAHRARARLKASGQRRARGEDFRAPPPWLTFERKTRDGTLDSRQKALGDLPWYAAEVPPVVLAPDRSPDGRTHRFVHFRPLRPSKTNIGVVVVCA